MNTSNKDIKLVIPHWQGGNNPAYFLRAKLLECLAPESDMPVFHVPVDEADGPLPIENGIKGRSAITEQATATKEIIQKEAPDRIVTLGGDCLVSLTPFSYLSEKYGDKLGVLWIDAHPDVQNPEQFSHSHAHVLGLLLGQGDSELLKYVSKAIPSDNVMIAGVHSMLPHEQSFVDQHGIATCSPEQIKSGTAPIREWIETQGIEYLAIHFDLDVLDSQYFRSVLFALPERTEDEFGGVAEGKLKIEDVVALLKNATETTEAVGLTIAEHLPWDAINLKAMLEELPLIGNQKSS